MEASEQEPLLPPTKSNAKTIRKLVLFLILSGYALAMSAPASMDLQYYSICRSLDISKEQCFTSPLAAQAEAVIGSYSSVIGSILKLALVPVVMVMAHKFDRKPVLIFALLISTLRHALMWYLAFFSRSSYFWLLVPTIFGVVYNSCTGLLMIPYVCAFAPDTEHRARYISWVVSAVSVTEIVGPVSGSTLIDFVGLYNFYLVAIGLELLSALIGGFLLEMRPTVEEDPEEPAEHPIKSLGCLALNHIHDPQQRQNGRKVIATFVMVASSSAALGGVIYLHVKYTFGWSAKEWGMLASAMSATGLLSYSFISPYLTSKLRDLYGSNEHQYDHVDRIALQYSIWVEILCYGTIGLFSKSASVFSGAVVMDGFSAIAAPSLIALVCKYGPRDNDGAGNIFASVNLAISSFGVVLPALMFKFYGLLVDYWPAMIYLFASCLFMVFSVFVATIKVAPPEHRSGTPVV